MRIPKLSASIMCADLLHLGTDIEILIDNQIDYLHFDIMDSHFVPSIGFGTFLLEQITAAYDIPLDVHLMVTNPENFIDELIAAGASLITIHLESVTHVNECLRRINNGGGKIGIALKPETPITAVEPFLDKINQILLMAYPPGIKNQKTMDNFGEKVYETVKFLDDRAKHSIDIAIDGGLSVDHLQKYHELGANFFILGSTGLFINGTPLQKQIEIVQSVIKR
jgi:ribulose-phosphate 3-epimerase